MNVEIITATEAPADVISRAAGTCYGNNDCSVKRVRNCFNAGHMSVFEHASATFRIEGISRACSHQLVRHRLASFCQESQRYCKYDFDPEGPDWYVTPPEIDHNDATTYGYHLVMAAEAGAYRAAIESGIKPEDARYLLPEATKTTIVMTANLREIFHILEMRDDKTAQWEIRRLAREMRRALMCESKQWAMLMSLGAAE